MTRNRNIDKFRALALMIVVIYHCWVLGGTPQIDVPGLDLLIKLGGEIGVTAFFALSGYGIYFSLSKTEQNGSIEFLPFMKKRLKRILPQYYVCFILVLILTTNAGYLTVHQIPNIATHLLLIHNLFPTYSGLINGVLWTMGTIFQFYIIAIPLYKLMNKSKGVVAVASIGFTVFMKFIMFHYLLQMQYGTTDYINYTFWGGRQLYTALDNFVLGMAVAYMVIHFNGIKKQWIAYLGEVLSIVALLVCCKFGTQYGIHTDNWSGYIWHSAIAICLALMMYFLFYIKWEKNYLIGKCLLWLSEYEYGIYLWHLIIILNMIAYSPIIIGMLDRKWYALAYIGMIMISVFVGWLFTELVDKHEWKIMKKK